MGHRDCCDDDGVMKIPPPVWLLAAGLAQRALAGDRDTTASSRVAAAGVAGTAVTLLGGSTARFRRHGTTIDPLRPDRASHLVVAGPNRLTRNPMYVGMAGLLVAHAALRRSPAALLPVAGFVAVIDRFQVAREEAALRERFGAKYADYCARVPRWVGPVR